MPELDLRRLDAFVLCGGLGQRLRAVVADRPKPLAEVAGRPFLDIVLEHVAGFGVRRFVLCAGYKSELIREHYAGAAPDREVIVSTEAAPLGTAGALRQACGHMRGGVALVLNGDSICRADLRAFADFHARHGGSASVVVAPAEPGSDYGVVALDQARRVTSFAEKAQGAGAGYINAGIYLLAREVLEAIPAGRASSLEKDVFPALASAGKIRGFPVPERVLDIGTPQRYADAQTRIERKP